MGRNLQQNELEEESDEEQIKSLRWRRSWQCNRYHLIMGRGAACDETWHDEVQKSQRLAPTTVRDWAAQKEEMHNKEDETMPRTRMGKDRQVLQWMQFPFPFYCPFMSCVCSLLCSPFGALCSLKGTWLFCLLNRLARGLFLLVGESEYSACWSILWRKFLVLTGKKQRDWLWLKSSDNKFVVHVGDVQTESCVEGFFRQWCAWKISTRCHVHDGFRKEFIAVMFPMGGPITDLIPWEKLGLNS